MQLFDPANAPDSIKKSLIVACSIEAAFHTWTERIDLWWPKSHSRSGDPNTTILLEGKPGGRLYERTSTGVEYIWGEITAWNPPNHLAYTWYLGSGPEEPSHVDVYFTLEESGRTHVEVEHRGPELIGALWSRNCTVYASAWDAVFSAYAPACDRFA